MDGLLTLTNKDGVGCNEEWRVHDTYTVPDFFAMVKRQLETLYLVSI